MLKKYYPYGYVKSVFSINYNKLYDKGYRGIIFDLDNTLVHHGDNSNEEVDNLFKKIQDIGFKTIILSDNDSERIERFLKNIDSMYISEAGKPNIHGFNKAVNMLGIDKSKCIVIGDQVFTDILGANKSGIDSILVKFIQIDENEKIGKKRHVEKIILKFYFKNKKYRNRLGNISLDKAPRKKLFCEINPFCYAISEQKEICKRHIKNKFGRTRFSKTISKEKLPVVLTTCTTKLIKRGKGVNLRLQKNKAVNIQIACSKINGMIIHPGETFSFWKVVGKPTKRRGFLDGRVLIRRQLAPGIGGGLCNLGNTIHRMVLNSPLDVVEFHTHSDALSPDEGGIRVPLSSGTSVSYNHVDFRFKNNTNQDIQILLWCKKEKLHGELRTLNEIPYKYAITEENHRFVKEGDKYYRKSKIYKETYDKETNEIIDKKLILENNSVVLFDYDLIPKDLIEQ